MNANELKLSVVVPAHNEEKLVTTFLQEVNRACADLKLSYEIIVVENGSTDRTWELLNRFSIKEKKVKALKLKSAGYGMATLAGIKNSKGQYIVVFNVDFWDVRFLEIIKVDLLGYDIVSSSKLLPGSKDLRSFSRRAVTWSFNKYLNLFLGFTGTDTHGVKALRAKTTLPIFKNCKTKSGIFDSEFMIRAQRRNLKLLELPVTVAEIRPNRFSVKRWLDTPRDIWQLSKTLRG